MSEIWKDHPTIVNYIGSNLGIIKNKKNHKNINGTIRNNNKKIFSPNRGSTYRFNIFIYECFNGILPSDKFIIEIDNNINNSKLNNLKLVNKEEYNKYLLNELIIIKEKEGWKLHYEYLYMANKKGEIFSVSSNELIKGRITDIEKTFSINNTTVLFKNIIYECFYGKIPEKNYIVYKDGIINNLFIDNLELVNEEQLKKYKQDQLNKIKETKIKEGWKIHYKFLNYLGNNEGKIFSVLTNEIINGHNTDGYIRINIYDDKLYNRYPVHRFIYECFNGKIEDKIQIDHINGIKIDNSINNLQELNSKDHNIKTFKNNESRKKQAIKMKKKILLIEYDINDKIISEKIYDSAIDLEKILNLSRVTISRYARNELNFDKYFIKYIDEEEIEDEIWISIDDDRFIGYEFSNMGRIKKQNGIITFGNITTDGYYKISINNHKYMMHYLICLAFNGLPNGEYGNEITVDHIDRNRKNNKSSNLKWSTRIEQATNTSKVRRVIAKYQDTKEIIGKYLSASDAARVFDLDCSSISKVCRGKKITSGKLNNRKIIWEYEDKTVI